MNDLPRRDPAPLYPRPGRFEETLRRARKRRQRSAVIAAAALVVVTAGGVAGAMSLTAGPNGSSQLAGSATSSATTDSSGSPGNTATAPPVGPTKGPSVSGTSHRPGGSSTKPGGSDGSTPSSHRSGGQTHTGGANQVVYRGKAVDAAGQPLSEIGVYVEEGGRQVLVATTSADGSFQIPCTNAPVLLATGGFARANPAGASSQQNYAYTYVQGSNSSAACAPASASSTPSTTVMNTGGKLTVTVTDANGQPIPGSTSPSLYCDASSTPCYTMTADASGQYTFSGLPTGDYTLRGAYDQRTYHVSAGQTTSVTWVEGTPSTAPTTEPPSTEPTTQPPSTVDPTNAPSTQGPDNHTPASDAPQTASPSP